MARLVPHDGPPFRDSPRRAVLFEHVDHCGGATVTDVLRRNFPVVLWGEIENPWHHLPRIPPDAREIVLANGNCRGLHADLPPDFDVYALTMLRNPWSRALSAYSYSTMTGYADCSLEEFLWDRLPPNPLVEAFGAGSLAAARRALERDFCAFGLCERFDESLELFGRSIPLADKRYTVLARSASRSLAPPEALRSFFLQRNRLDMSFHAFAVELFERRLRQAGVDGAPSYERLEPAPGPATASERDGPRQGPVPEAAAPPPHALMTGIKEIEQAAATDPARGDALLRDFLKRSGHGLGGTLVHLAGCLKTPYALKLLQGELDRFREAGQAHPEAGIRAHKAACLVCMAAIARNREDTPEEEARLRQALELLPLGHGPLMAWLDFLHRARRFQEAVETCRAHAGRFEHHQAAPLLTRLGENLAALGDAAGARAAFQAALEAYPLDTEAIRTFGVFLRQAGRPAEAEALFQAASLKPELGWVRPMLLQELACTRHGQGDKAGALRAVEALQALPARAAPPETARALWRQVPLCRAVRPGMRLTVIRTAPLLLLEFLLERLDLGQHPTQLVTPPLPEGFPLPPGVRATPLPPGRFVFEQHAPGLDNALWRSPRDAVILLLSDDGLPHAREVLRLARAIPSAGRYLYTLKQVYSPGLIDTLLEIPPA